MFVVLSTAPCTENIGLITIFDAIRSSVTKISVAKIEISVDGPTMGNRKHGFRLNKCYIYLKYS